MRVVASLLLLTLDGSRAPSAIAERVDSLEMLYHQHLHQHSGVFEWAGAYDDLAAGRYTWDWFKVRGMWGANDTAMHVAILPNPEGHEESPSTFAEGLHVHEESVVREATALCSPARSDEHTAWRVGDPPMTVGVCYDIKIDPSAERMRLAFIVSDGADYMIMTEHLPTEFAAGDALTTEADGNKIVASETALIKGQGTAYAASRSGGFIPGGAMVQDGVAAAALFFALLAFALSAAALCVACRMSRSPATPKFGTELAMGSNA